MVKSDYLRGELVNRHSGNLVDVIMDLQAGYREICTNHRDLYNSIIDERQAIRKTCGDVVSRSGGDPSCTVLGDTARTTPELVAHMAEVLVELISINKANEATADQERDDLVEQNIQLHSELRAALAKGDRRINMSVDDGERDKVLDAASEVWQDLGYATEDEMRLAGTGEVVDSLVAHYLETKRWYQEAMVRVRDYEADVYNLRDEIKVGAQNAENLRKTIHDQKDMFSDILFTLLKRNADVARGDDD